MECWYPVEMGDRPEADLALLGPQGRISLYIEELYDWEFDESGPVWEGADVVQVNALSMLKDAPG